MNVAEARSSVRNALSTRLDAELRRIRAADLYRVRRVIDGNHGADIVVDGRRCINFCSNDYLGLAGDPRLAVAAKRALDHAGVGSGGSALISGYNAEHRALEEALADFTGRPRALLFSSGWAANLGVLRGLLRRGDAIVADELNHASLIDGGRLSGADYRRVPHRDLVAYEATLSDLATAPAGALSLPHGAALRDPPWAPTPVQLARRFELPVIPIHIAARNSALHYALLRLSPRLRDLTVFRELVNKRRTRFRVTIGTPIPADRLPASDIDAITQLFDEVHQHLAQPTALPD